MNSTAALQSGPGDSESTILSRRCTIFATPQFDTVSGSVGIVPPREILCQTTPAWHTADRAVTSGSIFAGTSRLTGSG